MSFLLNRLWLVVKVYHFTCTVLLLCLVPLLVNSLFVAGIPVVQCDNPMLCFVSPNIYIYTSRSCTDGTQSMLNKLCANENSWRKDLAWDALNLHTYMYTELSKG